MIPYTRSISVAGLTCPLIVAVSANTPTVMETVRPDLYYQEGRTRFMIERITEPELYAKCESAASKLANGFLGFKCTVERVEPGNDLIHDWSNTEEGADYWSAQLQERVVGLQLDIDNIDLFPFAASEGKVIVEVSGLQSDLDKILGPLGGKAVDLASLRVRFWSTDFPTKGEMPIRGFITEESVTIGWEMRSRAETNTYIQAGVLVPIEPYSITTSNGTTLYLLS